VKAISQRDPRWADEKLGTSAETIGGYGCLITDIAMMANEAGDPVTPSELNARLIKAGGYADGNLLIFADVSKAANALTMTKLISCEEIPAPMDEIDARLAAGEMAAVEVWFERARKNKHWVLLYGKAGNSYLIADPWDGQLKRLSDYGFGAWSAATIIRRAVFYRLNRTAGMSAINAEGVRLRAAPGGKILGQLPAGTPVRILENGREWTRVAVEGFVATQFVGAVPEVAPIPQPTPPMPPPASVNPYQGEGRARLGVNVLNRHEEVALPLAQRGCRFFMVLNNPGFASRIKNEYPDAVVMVRRHWNRQMPSVEAAIAGMEGCHDPRLIYTGINEGDECGQGTVEQIRQRAEFDIALARRIKEISGATYAAGTFSMGTPDFTQPQICSDIRALYAEAYNSGLIWWDHHLYSPVIDHIYLDNELQWYETRWQFLFTRCGFNPASASRVVCSETGEDEGGWGGFPAHGRNEDQVAAWGRRFVEVQGRPLVVDGVAYPSPFVGGAIFQVGNREDWAGYNVEGLLGKVSWK